MDIYNHWGEHLLKLTGMDPVWDGTYLRQDCQQSVYLYVIRVNGRLAGDTRFFNGTVMLLP